MLPLFQIVIDLSYFQTFIHQPLSKQLFDAFFYVGWIPLVIIFFIGFREMWLNSKQTKYARGLHFVYLTVSIQALNEQSPKAAEHIFSHIAGTFSNPTFKEKWIEGKFTPPFSFEFAVVDGYTQFVIRAPLKHRDLIEAAIFSQYPDAEISEIPDYTQNVPQKHPDPEWDVWGTEFVLKRPSSYPIRTWFEFEHSLSQELKDPLSTILESFSRLKKGEQIWFQILVYPIRQDWTEESQALAAKMMGKEIKSKVPMWAKPVHVIMDLFENVLREILSGGEVTTVEKKKEDFRMMNMSPGERTTLEGIEMKMAKIGFGVKMRFLYVGKRSIYRKGPIASLMKGALGLFARLDGNSFGGYGPATPKSDYFWQKWGYNNRVRAIFSNYVNRSSNGADPYILNIEELASIYHFPSMLIRAPLIKKVESRKVEPPFALPIPPDDEEPKP